MEFEIIGNVDQDRLYCTASFTKFMTTFVCLSKLAEKYELHAILDDDHFLDKLCTNAASRDFLALFQKTVRGKFSLRDIFTFYNGLPYTFDMPDDELEKTDQGAPFKHHSIIGEDRFLMMCQTQITQVDPNHSKFHYSEIAIIFIGYFIEKVFDVSMESLYQKYVLDQFSLKSSLFSRTKPANVYIQDLTDKYDYPSIGIVDHGYFCYSNGFFTTLNDQKQLLEQLIKTPIFAAMSDVTKARAASNTIMNGLTVEIRMVGDDIIYGYEGFSYSGCNIWAYSTKLKKGYLTTIDSEDDAYTVIYGKFNYENFDKVPEYTQKIYHDFLETHHYDMPPKAIPEDYIGQYQRVKINDYELKTIFTVGEHDIEIRNPESVKYDVIFDNGIYRISCKDHMHGTRVGFYQAKSGHRYMLFDGTLFKKIHP